MVEQLLRGLPGVDTLLREAELAPMEKEFGRKALAEAVRQALGEVRREILEGTRQTLPDTPGLCREIRERLEKDALPSLRRVINGTGIVLHTNLGRACLSERAARAAADAGRRYSNLEYDLDKGSRGSRHGHVEALLCRLTGAEGALVVNNNAAAVLLALSALAQGGEVVVSRGELVEIGGSFRVPDIMEACGARLREVGTTNKTHLWDYEKAIAPETRALMKVHTSNYRIVGFTESPSLGDLVALGHSRGLPVIEDLGSGCLVDPACYGLGDEPSVGESLRAGVDLISFSGDKLLGGPQAGILLGKGEYLAKLRQHPLARAMRVDKMTLAALEATLRSYEAGRPEEVPVIAMLSATPEALEEKAQRLASLLTRAGVTCRVVATEGRVGGGSVPNRNLPSRAVALEGDVTALEAALRRGKIPIIGRIHNESYLLDVRTLWEEDFPTIAGAVREALG